MVMINQTATLLQKVLELMLILQVIFESMSVADDSFRGTLSVNGYMSAHITSIYYH